MSHKKIPKIILVAAVALSLTSALTLGLQTRTARRIGRGLCLAAVKTRSVVARSAAREMPALDLAISLTQLEKECS